MRILEFNPTILAEEMLPKQQNDTHPTNPDYPPISAAQFAKHVAKLHRNNNSGFKTEYTVSEEIFFLIIYSMVFLTLLTQLNTDLSDPFFSG